MDSCLAEEPPGGLPANVTLRRAAPQDVAALVQSGLPPLAARIFAARGITRRDEITPPLKDIPPPQRLPGLTAMAAALARVCASGEPICVVGDYDVDGTTATVLAYDCLQRLGARVSWHIPCRYSNGYGLTPAIVEQCAADGVKHLLMVDNGISAHDGIARAQALGLRVYVTDHHQPDERDNQSDYLVNPHANVGRNGVNGAGGAGGANGAGDEGEGEDTCNSDAYKNLVGVGIAFYLMAQLRREMNVDLDMAAYLDLLALGTVADCGKMDSTNRALVAAGLQRIRRGKTRPGIAALMRHCKLNAKSINSRAIGFRLAPRINAAGRMENADAAMHCLLAQDGKSAAAQAEHLSQLNQRRINQQQEVMNAVLQKVDARRAGIALGDESWSPGIIGIIAGKIADRFNRPCFIFHLENGTHWRGSGRAMANVDLYAILQEIAARHPQQVAKYGGHRQAAGIAIKKDFLPAFADLFDDICRQKREEMPPAAIEVDAISAADINAAALAELDNVVWGVGFPPPLYAGKFAVLGSEPLRGGHLQLRLRDMLCDTAGAAGTAGNGAAGNGEAGAAGADGNGGAVHSAVLFGKSELAAAEFTALFSANISPYNGKPQLVIERLLAPSETDEADEAEVS